MGARGACDGDDLSSRAKRFVSRLNGSLHFFRK